MTAIAGALQQPADDDRRFRTLDDIRAHQRDFNLRCHETWKSLHKQAIEELLVFDAVARREKEHSTSPAVVDWLNYERALRRKVNDAIIWSLAGMQRHVVKRLCLYRKRGPLAESNAGHALTVLDQLNTDPLAMAIWNDATSCVDVGDITLVNPRSKYGFEFIELKDGVVNRQIAELLGSVEDQDLEQRYRRFLAQHGPDGHKQLERVVRQAQRNREMMTLLTEERGRDPVTGDVINVIELKTTPENYDAELNGLLESALRSGKEVLADIDGCLWVYAATGAAAPLNQIRSRFVALLEKRRIAGVENLSAKRPGSDVARITELGEGLFEPLAVPLFVRRLTPGVVGEVLYGDLMGRVLFYVDWVGLGALVEKEGGSLTWGSRKETGRALSRPWESRPLVVNGRLLKIVVGESVTNLFGTSMIRMLFDGLRPSTIARFAVESSDRIAEMSREDPNK